MNWLRRKICEWYHVHSWRGVGIYNHEGEFSYVEMRCARCGRAWEANTSGIREGK
jgi:hypothetical protein